MTFRSPTERVDAPLVVDERRALDSWLDHQRATILWKLEGLDDEQLRADRRAETGPGSQRFRRGPPHRGGRNNRGHRPTDIHSIDLRWVMIHMIEETARHNGHADIIRELIDGSTGD